MRMTGTRVPPDDQPNIVVFLADDLGYECAGANGLRPCVRLSEVFMLAWTNGLRIKPLQWIFGNDDGFDFHRTIADPGRRVTR